MSPLRFILRLYQVNYPKRHPVRTQLARAVRLERAIRLLNKIDKEEHEARRL